LIRFSRMNMSALHQKTRPITSKIKIKMK